MTTQITTAPRGYSLHWNHASRGIWARYSNPERGEYFVNIVPLPRIQRWLRQLEDGTVVLTETQFTLTNVHGDTYSVLVIPDTQLPAEGMSDFHTEFDDATQKWRIPNNIAEFHLEHERKADHDVHSAEADLCNAEVILSQQRINYALADGAQRTAIAADLAEQLKCVAMLVSHNQQFAIERAWGVANEHRVPEWRMEERVKLAQAFATAFITALDSATDLGDTPKYAYALRLRKELLDDADRTGNARFLPADCAIVDTLSSPAVAGEITATALMAKLKTAIAA